MSATNDHASQPDVTLLLGRAGHGDQAAAQELIGLVYQELRQMAERQLRQESPGHTLEPTALVHEVFLKLVDQTHVDWQSRTHFLATGAQAMRRILVDYARRKKRQKRGQGRRRVELDDHLTVSRESPDDIVDVHEALQELEKLSPRYATIAELRFFAGMTAAEVAQHLGISKSTVDRECAPGTDVAAEAISEDDEP